MCACFEGAMWRGVSCAAIALALLTLTSCGGGGSGEDSVPVAVGAGPIALKQADASAPVALVAGPVSTANTTLAGNQVLRAIGATDDGGYTVAWLSADANLFMQHFDRKGEKEGDETLIAWSVPPPDLSPESTRTSSALAVLADGSIVVVYVVARPTPTRPAATGIYLQRFDADGAQVLAEMRVSSQEGSWGGRGNILGEQKAVPLADGGFVVGWTIWDYGLMGTRYSLWLERFDSQAQPVGAPLAIGTYYDLRYEVAADRMGGFTLRTSSFNPSSGAALSSLTHFDADMQAAAGQAPPVPSSALAARELADGTYLAVFRLAEGSSQAQRFSAAGVPVADAFGIQIAAPPFQAASLEIAALSQPGFAIAWTGQAAAGDSDVFTQAFFASLRDIRKDCLDAAKAQELKGQQRHAFMVQCAG